MDNFYFIGVDVSKKKLDFCVLFEGKVLREEQVSNHQQAVARLIGELKNDYTVVIVTHNMQQAARVSDYTAYMYLGNLVEFGETEQMFFKPERKETEDYITGRFG